MAIKLTDEHWSKYMAWRKDSRNDDMTDGMWCGQNMLDIAEFQRYKVGKPTWAQEVLDYRRSRMAEDILEVDKGLVRKAKEGNTQAASLLYARFEGWTPKVAENDSKRNPTNKSFADMIAEDSV